MANMTISVSKTLAPTKTTLRHGTRFHQDSSLFREAGLSLGGAGAGGLMTG
jgi:hypothetical protein